MSKDDYQEITDAVVEVVQRKIQSIIGAKTQSAETCWAGIKNCSYQSAGNLLEVNSGICDECPDIRYDKEKLFAQIEKIFSEEFEKIEEVVEKEKEEEREKERKQTKAAIIEAIEKI